MAKRQAPPNAKKARGPRANKTPATSTTLTDIPALSLFRANDRLEHFHGILREHDYGNFYRSATLVDELLTDPRIAGVVEQRVAGLMAAPLIFEPADGSQQAEAVAEVLGGNDKQKGKWRYILPQETQYNLMTWGLFLGIGIAQILWRSTSTEWLPYLKVWHPQHLRWDWVTRRFVLRAAGQEVFLPRPDEEPTGDGQWFLYCPFGVEYGWLRGLIRSLALPYMSRTWNETSFDRNIERQGLGVLELQVPSGGDPMQKQKFLEQASRLGSDMVIMAPQGTTKDQPGFGVSIKEFSARTWEAMKDRKAALDPDIAIRVLGQNLSTEVTQGSRAAAQVHELVRLDKALFDSEIGPALRAQVLTHWADWNHGDAELAPWPTYEVEPPEDEQSEAAALKTLGEAMQALLIAEPRVDVASILDEHGVPLLTEAQAAAMEAEEAAEGGTPPGGGGGADTGDGDEPTDAPADGGNGTAAARAALAQVQKRVEFAGLPIAVEHPAGSIRQWTKPDGTTGYTRMLNDYGHIEGYLSGDGEELDCYLGPNEGAPDVHVVHQLRAPEFRAHDEDKVILGAHSADHAKEIYLAHRGDERAFGGMSTIPLERFKAKLRRRDPETTTKIHASQGPLADRLVTLALGRRRDGAVRRSVAGRRREDKYHDKLVERSVRVAARALAPFLEDVRSEIMNATSLTDARRRALRAYPRADTERLAEVIKRMNVLGRLAGRRSARAVATT